MELQTQITFKNNPRDYTYLKENSYFIKELNRGTISYRVFVSSMKEKYKERISDKMENIMDNMDMISSVLNIIK